MLLEAKASYTMILAIIAAKKKIKLKQRPEAKARYLSCHPLCATIFCFISNLLKSDTRVNQQHDVSLVKLAKITYIHFLSFIFNSNL